MQCRHYCKKRGANCDGEKNQGGEKKVANH